MEHGIVMENNINEVIEDSEYNEEHKCAGFGSVLFILYLGEGEGSYIYVHDDLGKSAATCAGPCNCVHRVGKECN